jgi:TP901-1 family phage major tail protein
MAAPFDGALAIVKVNMGTEGTPDWQTVAAQQSFSYESSRNMLDGSFKGIDHAQSSYGRHESSATVEGLVSFADGTQAMLEDQMVQRNKITLRYIIKTDEATGETGGAGGDADAFKAYEAEALIASISRTFPDNENSTFSVEFNLNEFFQELV